MSDQRNGGIAWSDETWNPIRGCTRVSKGCENCYAERVAARFSGPGQPYEGLAKMTPQGPRWSRKVQMVPEHLTDPLRWSRARRVFVNSMSDLFHEGLTNEEIAAVFAVMVLAKKHTFQVLTKRPERAVAWFRWAASLEASSGKPVPQQLVELYGPPDRQAADIEKAGTVWPAENIWIGTSVEDGKTALARLLDLAEIPAAVRFVSAEPMIEGFELGLAGILPKSRFERYTPLYEMIQWVIIGGESGPGARPFDVDWARAMVAECQQWDVACFVKQLGSRAIDSRYQAGTNAPYDKRSIAIAEELGAPLHNGERYVGFNLVLTKDRKGGDPAEWPEEIRVREFPR